MKTKGLTVLVIIVAMCSLIAPVAAQSTPFMIYGYVSYEDGTACNNPTVNITNLNTNEEWGADTDAGYNYYQLILANGTDVNESEILRFSVTDESQSKVFNHIITSEEINSGGIFNANITLSVPNQQTWYFTDNDASVLIYEGSPTIDYQRIMTKGAEGGNEKITLEHGQRVWFYADHVAQCNVSFPAGNWDVKYWVKATDSADSGKNVYTRLHGINSSGGRLSPANGYDRGTFTISNPNYLEEVTEELNESFTIPEGGRFAIEVYWVDTASGNLEIYCNPSDKHSSQVTSPSSDPGYPVPELPTLILFSSGLIILAGYVLLKRRNTSSD